MKLLKIILPMGLAALACSIYLATAPLSMFWLDSARLFSAIYTFSIPNPPEPLYMLIGHLFSYLPLGSFIFRIQLLSALFAFFTLVLLYRLIYQLILKVREKNSEYIQFYAILSSSFGMLTMAFSYQFWSQSQNIETFILVTLLSILIISVIFYPLQNRTGVFKKLIAVAVLFGLGSGTNPILVSSAPAVLVLMLANHR